MHVSFFRPLKVNWYEACHKFVQKNPGRVITKYAFSPLFAQAWYKAIRPQNLIYGFEKAGVCPFNPEAIKIPTLPPEVSEGELTDEHVDGDLDKDSLDGSGDLPYGDEPSGDLLHGDEPSGDLLHDDEPSGDLPLPEIGGHFKFFLARYG